MANAQSTGKCTNHILHFPWHMHSDTCMCTCSSMYPTWQIHNFFVFVLFFFLYLPWQMQITKHAYDMANALNEPFFFLYLPWQMQITKTCISHGICILIHACALVVLCTQHGKYTIFLFLFCFFFCIYHGKCKLHNMHMTWQMH